MKRSFTIIFFLFSVSVIAQKQALIDRSFKNPILFTDSVTISQVSSNYFPVAVKDLDSLVANLSYLKGTLTSLQRAKFKSYKLKCGNTEINIKTVPHAYGDSYDILLLTSVNNINAEYLLADNKSLNKKAIKNIDSFINFIKKDKQLIIKEFKEYNPFIYDATIYIPNK